MWKFSSQTVAPGLPIERGSAVSAIGVKSHIEQTCVRRQARLILTFISPLVLLLSFGTNEDPLTKIAHDGPSRALAHDSFSQRKSIRSVT